MGTYAIIDKDFDDLPNNVVHEVSTQHTKRIKGPSIFSLIFYSPGNCVIYIVIDSSLLKSELDSKFCFCSNGVLRYLFVA
ncbi:hypothetical protein VIGAN_06034900 [Vigna angularis var. angularis]|uniref:Uncharacterized protein n=1 Tax=Vigna angularis var. angularis TaxID=157739 RepID=A0A0S3S9D3_PHAAN|nr:hypothetical protein VIGAN_06034900 [Vigna angularis var. angularis]